MTNPDWQAKWQGKKIYDSSGNVAFEVTKDMNYAATEFGVDALSGATLTSNGVTESIHFWFGDEGFKPYILAHRQEGL